MTTRPQRIAKLLYQLGDSFSDDLTRQAAQLARARGLSSVEFSFVCELGYRGTMTISEVAEQTGLSLGAASGLVERLVKRGLVERSENPENRRSKNVKLTEAGAALPAELDRLYLEHLERAVAHLPDETLERFEAILADIVARP